MRYPIARRTLLTSASLLFSISPAMLRAATARRSVRAEPISSRHVTLKPSPFADAMKIDWISDLTRRNAKTTTDLVDASVSYSAGQGK